MQTAYLIGGPKHGTKLSLLDGVNTVLVAEERPLSGLPGTNPPLVPQQAYEKMTLSFGPGEKPLHVFVCKGVNFREALLLALEDCMDFHNR